jgi:hypothetical protein
MASAGRADGCPVLPRLDLPLATGRTEGVGSLSEILATSIPYISILGIKQ